MKQHATSPVPARPLGAMAVRHLTRNILATYRSATPDEYVAGVSWYWHAHGLAVDLAEAYGLDVATTAGVLAALSPQHRWEKNVTDARKACAARSARGLHTYCQTDKADAILAGTHPVDVLRGRKETSFFHNILQPECELHVTIDRHAHDIAVGRRFGDQDRGLSSAGRYANISLAYRRAAAVLGELPVTVQAVTWNVHTARGAAELVILTDDQWNTDSLIPA